MKKFVASKLVLKFVEKTSRISLSAFLQQADCLLANGTGPLHLATSLGTSVVSLFTCTSPQISGSVGAGHEPVSSCVVCHASYQKRCPNRGSRHLALHGTTFFWASLHCSLSRPATATRVTPSHLTPLAAEWSRK
jgi:hypothetical protein